MGFSLQKPILQVRCAGYQHEVEYMPKK